MDDIRRTLLVAMEDFGHLFSQLAEHESALDRKSSYCSLRAQCLMLQHNLQNFLELDRFAPSLREILEHLEAVVLLDSKLPILKAAESTTVAYPGLRAFHQAAQLSLQSTLDALSDQANLSQMKNIIDISASNRLDDLENLLVTANKQLNNRGAILADPQIQRRPRQRPPDHIMPAADSLFKVLDSKKRCKCDPGHQYVVQLCLETHLARIQDCDFDLFLGLEHNWQEARIQTVTTKSSSESPKIIVSSSEKVASLTSLGSARKRELKRKVERLCADIIKIRTTLPDYGLRFRMEEDCLWKLQSERSNFSIDPSKAPVTLAQFISKTSNLLNEKTKRVLGVLLSYAIYHLMGTPWLKSWGSSNITFFRSTTGLPLRPYIETHLSEEMIDEIQEPTLDNEDDDFDPDDDLRPPYPCLVDLSVVLLELHKAASLDSMAEMYDVDTSSCSEPVMSRYLATREIFRYCAPEMTDQTRMAVKACLSPAIGLHESGDPLNEHELRDRIYQQIVRPLEDELEQGFSDLAVDRLDDLVRSLDLANGGQPLPLYDCDRTTARPGNRPKRRGSDDIGRPRARVRFTNLLETNVRDKATQSEAIKTAPNGLDSDDHKNNKSQSKINLLLSARDRRPNTRSDTIRVVNVPDSMSKEALKRELDNAFGSSSKIYSLARASRAANRWRKHATVTFPDLPNHELNESLRENGQTLQNEYGLQYDKLFIGVTPLYDAGEDAVVDIIVLEGLGTNAFGTFRSPEGEAMWLRDFLPGSLPNCRILLYGYDSKVPASKSNQSVPEIAGTCKSFIKGFRKMTETTERPIIWIGQSMGGLVVQEVLIQSHQYSSTDTGNLASHTAGFLGYGVPTNGLRNETLLDLVGHQPNFDMIQSICIENDRPSRYLVDLSNRFALCCKSFSDRVSHFYETNPSPDLIDSEAVPIRRVDDPEAVGRERCYWIPANHSELVKIASPSDLTYTATVLELAIIMDDILPNVRSRSA